MLSEKEQKLLESLQKIFQNNPESRVVFFTDSVIIDNGSTEIFKTFRDKEVFELFKSLITKGILVNEKNIDHLSDITSLLTSDEYRCIKLFQIRVCELQKTTIISSNVNIESKIDLTVGEPFLISANIPPEKELKELFLAFRFFYLNDEPSNFFKIANILSKMAKNKTITEMIRNYKKRWENSLFRGTISYDKQRLTSQKILDLWFNAHYFHQLQDREQELEKLNSYFSIEGSKSLLINSVLEATNVIFQLYQLCKLLASSVV